MIEQTKNYVEEKYTIENGYQHNAKVKQFLKYGLKFTARFQYLEIWRLNVSFLSTNRYAIFFRPKYRFKSQKSLNILTNFMGTVFSKSNVIY